MNKMKVTLAIIAAFLAITLIFILVLFFSVSYTPQYVTTNIADYGQYKGNYDNKSVQNYIHSFFPEKIENTFENVTYSYKAQKGDAYAFEAYLSFSIENDNDFETFLHTSTAGLEEKPFQYDPAYTEYTVDDIFQVTDDSSEPIHIRYAKIGKILCNPENNEVIFVALGVYDGGLAEADFLCVYFDRFQIDPLAYARQTADTH